MDGCKARHSTSARAGRSILDAAGTTGERAKAGAHSPHARDTPISDSRPPTPEPLRDDLVVRTRFVPPAIRRHIIARPRVEAIIERALEFPLTIVKAEPGYGKTTAVASWLAATGHRHVWYNVGETEADPRVFLLHLVQALRSIDPLIGERSVALLEHGDRAPRLWDTTVDGLSNDLLDRLTVRTVLVLDDYDRVNSSEVNAIVGRLVETMPPLLHLIMTARRMPSFRGRARWRASGEMLEVTRSELAFTSDEVASLLERRLSQPPSREVALAVTAETEGWPIALQMLSDSLGAVREEALDSLLERIPGPSDLLFDYLAEEVFSRQTPEVRQFLGESALLRRLDPETCDRVLGVRDTAEVLRLLENSSLFVTADGGFRYHHLFRDFLMRRSGVSAERQAEIHRDASAFFRSRGDDEEAVHHMLAAKDYTGAADALVRLAAPMAGTGRHQTFGRWLDQLPDTVLSNSPELLLARAETSRISCRYAEALPAYIEARRRFRERGDVAGEQRALRGHALFYLDTVQPAHAQPLLREALRLTSGDRNARNEVFLLLAENRLNAGDLRKAERLFRAVNWAQHHDATADINPRVYVRQGRFAEAHEIIEASHQREAGARNNARPHRSHRESSAMLAWTDIMVGQSEGARQHASESVEIGQLLGSPVVECIATARVGLGWLTGHDYDPVRAADYFKDAIRIAERIGVARFKVEPLLGMTIVHGLEGFPDRAEASGREALLILKDGGDEYVRGVVCAALGAALVQSGGLLAESWLIEAEQLAEKCGDRFVFCVAALWLAIHYSKSAQLALARQTFVRALERSQQNGYSFLFGGTPLLAPKDSALIRSLLRRALEHPEQGAYAQELLSLIEPDELAISSAMAESLATAPLYIQTLGPFRVWRHGQEIERSAWSREKSLLLLQLLVCNRTRAVHRDEIIDALWDGNTSSTATTGLRVALSALRTVLEPGREAGVDSTFVRRDGDTIRLANDVGVRVDADEFGRLFKAARVVESSNVFEAIARYERALALYRGEFLGDNRYVQWAEAERQERRREFLVNAERLAGLLVRVEEFERAARWAETMLQHDPLWEAAYALLMESYWRQGNRALAVRAYNRCQKRLKAALGVAPSSRTQALLVRISQRDAEGG